MFKFLKTSKNAKSPEKKNGYFELFASEEVVIPPYEKVHISTNIRMEFPSHYFVYVNGSTPTRRLLAGVVDSDYRGEMKVMIFNRSEQQIKIKQHEKCAKMHCIELSPVIFTERTS